ncbi:Uncharacterized protein PECH_007691 [Penicillium ucsense]|uniref:Anaphase-promoting complex subunit 2 n=1 Tax=Penicillium ucsense TaxID=2839758 RepID=A0A8J8W8K9_9EURO|nr:Uncharacterized protein PECM_003819 [Penicillium ucsense]KAF7734754.1 Uncharacterized protein PECH_007691 [Penicillium ucsense]
MINSNPLNVGRRRVFGSVFSPAPFEARSSGRGVDNGNTQAASPFHPDASFSTIRTGSFNSPQPGKSFSSTLDRETWNQAWCLASDFLSLPHAGFAEIYNARGRVENKGKASRWHRPPSQEVAEALSYLACSESSETSSELNGLHELLLWYGGEIRRHFLANMRQGLHELFRREDHEELIRSIVECLQLARRMYLTPVANHVLKFAEAEYREKLMAQLQRVFHTVVSYSLPWSKISPLISVVLAKEALIILGIDTLLNEGDMDANDRDDDAMEVDRRYSVFYDHWRNESPEGRERMMIEGEDNHVTTARERLLMFLQGLQQVGLGGDKTQKVFASVMNIMMTEFIRAAYTGKWEAPSLVPQHLRHWVEDVFARLAVQVLAIIHHPRMADKSTNILNVSFSDVEKWQEMGIARLGTLRTSELFDVIVEWPASTGAIEDLRHFTTYPAARSYLTHNFITVLNQRLLQPGASTLEILQLYIAIIRAFNLMDPKGVILDRIARPIRRYLRDRDDTIKVIVSGLLAEPTSTPNRSALPSTHDTLAELPTELSKAHQLSMENNMSELDWDDMNWMPDPVDAAPDFSKSKGTDVIDSVVSLFDSKETFVKELQTMLSDRLLQNRDNYDQEISVLELLKIRFGESTLQACEVMLRDISDSRRVDASIRRDQGLVKLPTRPRPKRSAHASFPDLHAKILSRFFWPIIPEQEFKIPDEIAALQERYAAGFEALKASRKLTWLNGLGQVLVELKLADREFSAHVTTWQATVIYAFQSDSSSSSSSASEESNTTTERSISSLAEQLSMTPSLVRSACLFWVSKRILAESSSSSDTYHVLESLPTEEEEHSSTTHHAGQQAGQSAGTSTSTGPQDNTTLTTSAADAAAAAEAAAAAAAKESADAAAMEKMNLYWQFIMGMLTNQGAMPLQRIVMMLKIVVPGGFPFSNEELREFLAGMVAKGKVEIVSGGNYKLVH